MVWKPGQSGNPSGHRPGPSRVAKLRKLLEPHASDPIAKAVELALASDTTALKVCLERLLPPIREEPVKLRLQGSLSEQGQTILATVAAGDLSPTPAARLLQALAHQAKLVEVDELERRVAALEANRGRS